VLAGTISKRWRQFVRVPVEAIVIPSRRRFVLL